MRLGTFCSGIGVPELVGRSLEWQSVFCSEIDPHANSVLAHHFPDTPNLGDMTQISGEKWHDKVDIAIAGTPCVGFSPLGTRQGLDDERSALAIAFVELLRGIQPRWLVWEQVASVLYRRHAHEFAEFTKALTQCGYHLAYRVLDSIYWGVPQYRRRLFLVGYLGDWRPPAAVLFEHESMRGDLAPSRKSPRDFMPLLTSPLIAFSGKDRLADVRYEACPTIRATNHNTTWANSGKQVAIASPDFVRWITPLEAERAMGLPDRWTDVPHQGKPMADGARYRLIGNAIARPPLQWICDRINIVNGILLEQ